MDLLLTDYEYKYNNGSNGEDDRLMIDERNLISSGKTLLMLACSQGNKDMIKILIKHRIDALFKNYNGNTALHISCQHRNTEVAEMLLQYQPEIVNIQNKNGKTPLMIACKLGDTLMVSLLLKYNGSINLKDHNGKTALMIACKYGHIDTINYIVDYFDQINKKENPIKRDQSSNVFLINRISKSKMYQIKHKIKIHQRIKSSLKTSKLLNYNMNPKNFMDSSCSYLLNKFKKNNSKSSKTCFNRMNILTHTLATFIKANNKNNKKYPISKGIIQNSNLTPHLNDNYHHGHHNMSNDTNTGFPKPITITNNEIIDINSKDTKYGYSALLWACKYNGNNTIKIIEKLLAIGANINDVSNMNQNALILSIITPSQITNTNQPINLDLISFLLHHGIDINVSSSSDKYTALMLACQKRYQLVVKMLLNAHAERSLLNNEGKTAMDIALINNYFEIVQLF